MVEDIKLDIILLIIMLGVYTVFVHPGKISMP